MGQGEEDIEDASNENICMHVGCRGLANKTTNVQLSEGLFVTLHYCPVHSWEWD
jgi:nitrite reductase/ring-hydroxylating ferredoxin subunit